jgi:hypothetical protein
MAKGRSRALLLAAALVMGLSASPCAQATSGGVVLVSCDLRDAPFEEALRQLFSQQGLRSANYVLQSEPPKDARATARVTKKLPDEALSLVLREYGMTCRWVHSTAWISRADAGRESEPRLILYLRRNGHRTQLRLRASPYENGGEKLLWESPKDRTQSTYLFPSPSFRYAAVSWWGSHDPIEILGPRLLLVPLAGGEVNRIETPGVVQALVWTQDDELEIIGSKGEHWRYHPSTDTLTEESLAGEEVLEAAHATQVRELNTVLSRMETPIVLPADDLQSLVRAEGWHSRWSGRRSQAAVSPDRQYAALVGAEAAVYVVDAATGAVRQKISATRLVETEAVTLGHLHWSQDSTRLLFTESHYHAAKRHTPFGPPGTRPSVTDWTKLVREYSLASDQTSTLTAGYDAHEVPPEAAEELLAGSNPEQWDAEDDQSRWGRTARHEREEWSPDEEQRIARTLSAVHEAATLAATAEERARARWAWLYGGLVGAGVVLAGGRAVAVIRRGRQTRGGSM